MAVEEPEILGEGGGGDPSPRSAHPIEERLEQLAELREQALHAGSPAAVERQHDRGKLTARERLEMLLDPGSFVELDMLARHRAHGFGIENTRPLTDGVVTGWGTIDGRKVFVFAQDFTVFGGALGEVFAEKIHKVMDLAESVGAPIDRPQRRRRRPHPGGRRLARRLRRDLLPQREGVGRHPADQRDHRARAPAAPSTRRR